MGVCGTHDREAVNLEPLRRGARASEPDRVPEVLLQRLEHGGITHVREARPAEPSEPVTPADRPGERLAPSLGDPSLQVQVSHHVGDVQVLHPPRVRVFRP